MKLTNITALILAAFLGCSSIAAFATCPGDSSATFCAYFNRGIPDGRWVKVTFGPSVLPPVCMSVNTEATMSLDPSDVQDAVKNNMIVYGKETKVIFTQCKDQSCTTSQPIGSYSVTFQSATSATPSEIPLTMPNSGDSCSPMSKKMKLF